MEKSLYKIIGQLHHIVQWQDKVRVLVYVDHHYNFFWNWSSIDIHTVKIDTRPTQPQGDIGSFSSLKGLSMHVYTSILTALFVCIYSA